MNNNEYMHVYCMSVMPAYTGIVYIKLYYTVI